MIGEDSRDCPWSSRDNYKEQITEGLDVAGVQPLLPPDFPLYLPVFIKPNPRKSRVRKENPFKL